MAAGDRDRWNEKWAGVGTGTHHGSNLIDLLDPWLPTTGTVLDIAGGGSPSSLAFARRGFEVTVCDVSDVGLELGRARAEAEALTITTVEMDLESDPLPAGPRTVITVANYLQRDLLGELGTHLSPGGVLGVIIATERNLEHHEKPSRPFLLDTGELPTLVGDLEVLHHSEEWRDNGRHEAHLVARRQV